MALNSLYCADVPLSNYSLTPRTSASPTCTPKQFTLSKLHTEMKANDAQLANN